MTDRTHAPLDDIDFGGDNLATRAKGVLQRSGCATLADAEAMVTVDSLHGQRNCGLPTVRRIAQVMEHYGYRLRWGKA